MMNTRNADSSAEDVKLNNQNLTQYQEYMIAQIVLESDFADEEKKKY
jgi:hypothetical protein